MERILQGLNINYVWVCGIFVGMYGLAHMERHAAQHRECWGDKIWSWRGLQNEMIWATAMTTKHNGKVYEYLNTEK